MAQLTIRLVVDQGTGKKNVIIGYESDASALPMEHEEDHKRLVQAVLAGTGLSPDEIGDIIVEREGQLAPVDETPVQEPAQPQALSEDQ